MTENLFLDPFAVPEDREVPQPRPTGSERDAEVFDGEVVASRPAVDTWSTVASATIPLELSLALGAFLDDTHLWWPRELKRGGGGSHIGFEDGHLVEEDDDGRLHTLATLSTSPGTLQLEWRRTRPRDAGTPDTQGEAVVHLGLIWSEVDGAEGLQAAVEVRGPVGDTDAPDGPPEGTEAVAPQTSPRWVGEWTTIIGAYARFMGGSIPSDQGQSEEGQPG